MNSRKRVLIVGGKDFAMSCLTELGIAFTLIQKASDKTEWQTKNAELIIEMDYEALDHCPLVVHQAHMECHFDAVFSFTEFGLYPAAKIADELDIPSNCNIDAVTLTRNKFLLREKLRTLNQYYVPFLLTNDLASANVFMEAQSNGIIVKPVSGAGSLGVFFAKDAEALALAFNNRSDSNQELLLEKFIGGDEYSIETLSKSGQHEVLAITQKTTSGSPHFVELGHVQPALLDQSLKSDIEHFCIALLDIVGHKDGPCHSEIKVENGAIFLIETQTRNGGDHIWRMTQITTGADLFKETYQHILKLPQSRPLASATHSEIRYFCEPQPCKNLIETYRLTPGVCDIHWRGDIGGSAFTPRSSYDRAGYILAAGCSLQDTRAAIQGFSLLIENNG